MITITNLAYLVAAVFFILGLKKLGVAFCVGLKEETTQLAKILESHGFELSTVACMHFGHSQQFTLFDVDDGETKSAFNSQRK